MKKIALLASILTFLTATYLYGFWSHRQQLFPAPELARIFRELRSNGGHGVSTSASADRPQSDLGALGYADGYVSATGPTGTLRRIEERMAPGNTLFCSSHAAEVFLIDPRGGRLQTWSKPAQSIWPDYESAPELTGSGFAPTLDASRLDQQFVRRAKLLDSGDLVVLFEYFGLAQLDEDSNVKWSVLQSNHHDFDVLPDGRILSLAARRTTQEELETRFPGLGFPTGIVEDFVLTVSATGEVVHRQSIFEAILKSKWASSIIGRIARDSRAALRQQDEDEFGRALPLDILHANSIKVATPEFSGTNQLIPEGHALLSLREHSLLVAMDPATGEISWVDSGQWAYQHQATPLSNGNILLLDNKGGNRESPWARDRSRVIEYDPVRRQIVRTQPRSSEAFFTEVQGYVEPQANGNTLITETTRGRILEVDPDGAVVWEFQSPFKSPTDRRLTATVMGAMRVSARE
ncbi:arylsulfotransferase family protein [Planctomycetota bacterium]|nr:arylsulfotransferase family protein [Planctomycetota bacterium]